MFEDLKDAWREAVVNFRRELHGEEAPDALDPITGRRRELARAAEELHAVDADLARAREQLAADLEAERVCRRREALAQGIGDRETARIASEFAARHAERATVLARKVDALAEEHRLRAHELAAMESALREPSADLEDDDVPPPPRLEPDPAGEDDEEFRRLDRNARERDAEARLDELKRRMR